MSAPDRYLVDTNVLLRCLQPAHSHHPRAITALEALTAEGQELRVVRQTLYEFWAVATRPPAVGGLGRTPAEAEANLLLIEGTFAPLDDTPAVYPTGVGW